MSVESLHSIIMVLFVSMWALIGQFTFVKH